MLRAITVMALVGLVLGSSAQAAPKTIAIVNLSQEASAADDALRVRALLERSEGLRPTTPGDLARSLEDALPKGGPDAQAIVEASENIASSMTAFSGFKSRTARAHLESARSILFGLAPNEDTSRLLADVSFNMALIHMRAENNGLAMGELQLLHRLVERKTIDPVRYPPGVVRAFDQARKTAAGKPTATISISATYDGAPVFVDGVSAGSSPITVLVSPGSHVVAIAAPQYQATAILIDIDSGSKQSHRIDLEPRNQVVRARELRFEAKVKGLTESEIRIAASRVARLVGSDAVLVLLDETTDNPGKSVVATLYVQHLDKLTYQHPINKNLKHMLGLVTGVARPTLLDGIRDSEPVPWYKKTWPIAAIGSGTALTIVGLIFLGTNDDTNPPRTLDTSVDIPASP